MKTTGLVKYAAALVVVTICSGCGSASAVGPSNAALNVENIGRTLAVNGRPVTAERLPLSLLPRYRTILSDRHRKSKRFEYIINDYGSYASIFDYPKSVQQIGTLYNVGGQGCTNALYGYGKGIFWIVAAYNQINEYEVPSKPIKTLSVSASFFPTSCAMNTTGDLAVGIYGPSGGGDVVIFSHASGSGTLHTTPLDEEFFDGYDNQGNLFADGFTGYRSGFALVELPKGSSKFQTITTTNSVQFPGSVQWDGKYLVVFDQEANEFYRYKVSGTKATLERTVTLTGAGDCAQTWIVRRLVYCADAFYGGGEIFKYPAGGSPVAVLEGNFDVPLGVTASRK